MNEKRSSISVKWVLFIVGLLVFRGILLWLVVPLVCVLWLVALPVRVIRQMLGCGRAPSLSQYLAWADLLLVGLLERSVLRPLAENPDPLPGWPERDTSPSWGSHSVWDFA